MSGTMPPRLSCGQGHSNANSCALHTRAHWIECPLMSTNLPSSRNRDLPPPPAAARSHPAAPQHPGDSAGGPPGLKLALPAVEPDNTGRGPSVIRSVLAMLVVGALLFAGIFFYIRGADKDVKRQEQVSAVLLTLGKRIWELRGFTDLPAATEERQKDLQDMPRIFAAAHAAALNGVGLSGIVPVEGDPPPGRGNATHQIQFFFGDVVRINIRVYYDAADGSIQFIGVHNRFVPSRDVLEEDAERLRKSAPATLTPAPAPIPPVPASAPPAEKVSEAPAIPR